MFPPHLPAPTRPIIPTEPWAHRARYADQYLRLCPEGPSWWYVGAYWVIRDAAEEFLARLPVTLARPTTLLLMDAHAAPVLREHGLKYKAAPGTPFTGPVPSVVVQGGVVTYEVRRWDARHTPVCTEFVEG